MKVERVKAGEFFDDRKSRVTPSTRHKDWFLLSLLKFIFVIFIALFCSSVSLAHGPSAGSVPQVKVLEYQKLIEKVSLLDFEVAASDLKINAALRDLFRMASRDYIAILKDQCNGCNIELSEEQLMKQAEALVAQGWFARMGRAARKVILMRYGTEVVVLGGIYGTAIGVAKAIGELLEDAAAVAIKSPGLHVACELITAGLALSSGGVSTAWRSYAYAHDLGEFGIEAAVKQLVTHFPASQVYKTMTFQVGPTLITGSSIDLESQSEVANHWSQLVHSDRERQRLDTLIETWNQETLDHYNQIQDLVVSRDNLAPDKIKARQRLDKKIEKLRESPPEFTVRRVDFEGRRYGGIKTFVFALPIWVLLKLKKRNNDYTLHQLRQSGVYRNYRGTNLWYTALINAVLDPAYRDYEALPEEVKSYRAKVNILEELSPISEIDNILLGRASQQGINRRNLRLEFDDINRIYEIGQKSVSRREVQKNYRAYYSNFVWDTTSGYLAAWGKVIFSENSSVRNILRILKVRWKVARIFFFTNRFFDYLLAVSLSRRDKISAFDAEFAKEYMVEIHLAMNKIAKFGIDMTEAEVSEAIDGLNQSLDRLNHKSFWIRKPAVTPFLEPVRRLTPFLDRDKIHGFGSRKRLMCRELYI